MALELVKRGCSRRRVNLGLDPLKHQLQQLGRWRLPCRGFAREEPKHRELLVLVERQALPELLSSTQRSDQPDQCTGSLSSRADLVLAALNYVSQQADNKTPPGKLLVLPAQRSVQLRRTLHKVGLLQALLEVVPRLLLLEGTEPVDGQNTPFRKGLGVIPT